MKTLKNTEKKQFPYCTQRTVKAFHLKTSLQNLILVIKIIYHTEKEVEHFQEGYLFLCKDFMSAIYKPED